MTDKEKIAHLEKENLDLKKDLDFYKKIVDEIHIMMHINEIKDNKYFDIKWTNSFYKKRIKKKIEERNKNKEDYYQKHYAQADVKMIENVVHAVQNNKEAYSVIYNYKTVNGISKWYYTVGSPYKYSDKGDLEQVLCASIDLTGEIFNPDRYADMQKELNKLKHQLTLSKLSETEINILKILASGKTEKEIAETQSRSIHTIKTHLKNIRKKLNISKNTELVKFAIATGIA